MFGCDYLDCIDFIVVLGSGEYCVGGCVVG